MPHCERPGLGRALEQFVISGGKWRMRRGDAVNFYRHRGRPHSGECTECIFDTGKLNKIWDAETDGELNDILGADLDDNLGDWEEMWSNDGRDRNGKEILERYNADGYSYDSYGFYILGENRDGIYHADVSTEWQGAVDPISAAN